MERILKLGALALGLALASPVAAQDRGPGSVDSPATKMEVTAKDFTLSPDRLVVTRSQNIDLTMINEGAASHGLVLKLPDAEVKFSDPVEPKNQRTLSFRAPDRAGEYEIYCPMGNHRERGMTATLVVR